MTIRRIKRGKGYSFVRANGTHIRHAGTIRRLHSMAVPPAYREVRYSADPSSHLQAVGRDAAGRLQYRYHADWEKVREQRKAHRLAKLVGALPKIRRNVSTHLSGDEPTREFALSAVIELIARTAIRPGNKSYARLNGTRGATTLLKSNVTLEDDTVVLTFKAKGGKAVRKECDAAKLVRAIGILRGVPGKRMFQYRDASGIVRAVSTTQVNAFLREIAGIKISLKDFRTLMASAVVLESLSRISPAASAARPQEAGAGSGPRRRRRAVQHAGDLPQELRPRHHRHRLRGRHPRALCRDDEGLPLAGQARAAAGAGGDGGGGVTTGAFCPCGEGGAKRRDAGVLSDAASDPSRRLGARIARSRRPSRERASAARRASTSRPSCRRSSIPPPSPAAPTAANISPAPCRRASCRP